MKLNNPFPEEVRLVYLYRYDCDLCGCNQNLQIHHITGRGSDSIFNASLLCGNCHSTMGHSQEEEQILFAKNFKWVYNKTNPSEEDLLFIRNNYQRLFTQELEKWLGTLKNKNPKNQKSKMQSANIYKREDISFGDKTMPVFNEQELMADNFGLPINTPCEG